MTVPDNCPSMKIVAELGLGFASRSELVFRVGATRQLPPRKTSPQLGLRFGLELVLWLWDNFPRGQLS